MAEKTNPIFLLNPHHESIIKDGTGTIHDVTKQDFIVIVIINLTLCLLFLWLIALTINERSIDKKLANSGISIAAKVIGHRKTEGKGAANFLTYTFSVENSNHQLENFVSEEPVDSDLYKVTEGNSVTVRYLPDDPNISKIMYNKISTTLVLILGVIMFILVLGNITLLLRKAMRNRLLSQKGQLLYGKIISSKRRYAKGGEQIVIDFHFVSPSNVSHATQQSRIRNDLKGFTLPLPGTSVAIMYINDKLFRML